MNNSVKIQLGVGDNKSQVESIRDFFTPFVEVYIEKDEGELDVFRAFPDPTALVLTIIGTWATEKYILDPLAYKASEWIKSIKTYWEKAGSSRDINVIIKFEEGVDNLDIVFSGVDDPRILEQVWHIARNIIELIQSNMLAIDLITISKVRITRDAEKRLLIIAYSRNVPKYTINLDTKEFLPITAASEFLRVKAVPQTDNQKRLEESWTLGVLMRRLKNLKIAKQKGYDISESEIANLEREIESQIARRSLKG